MPGQSQLDLFGGAAPSPAEDEVPLAERYKASAEFVDQIRRELLATLESVRGAETFPWPDLTRMTLGEMRFHSIARWLPREEAEALCAAFEVEMERLYEVEDERSAAAG